MAELAGLVLSGIPIAIWALEKYAEPFETYTHYHTAISTLKTNLELQKWQLEATLANIGLHQPTTQELRECFEKRYPERHPELMFIIQRMEEVTASLMENLDVDMEKKPRWSNEPPERVQWEWRRIKRTFGGKKREKLVQELRSWNDDLRNCLEKVEMPAEDDNRNVQKIKLRYNSKSCDALRESLKSLHRAVESVMNCESASSHRATIELDWTATKADTPRTFSVALSHNYKSNPPQSSTTDGIWKRFDVKIAEDKANESQDTLLPPPSPKPPRSPSPSGSVRFKVSHPSSGSRKPDPAKPSPVISTELAALKTPPIRNLCAKIMSSTSDVGLLGVLEDPQRMGDQRFTLGHAPKESPDIVKMIPLKELLPSPAESKQEHSPYSAHALSAKQRYGIAASIAWSVLHLSGSSWLGDQWDRCQLKILLEKGAMGSERVARNPWTSYSFPDLSDSLPIKDDTLSRSIPNKTIFALGILLIELGINEGFGSGSPESILTTDYATLQSKLDKVYREAGDSYGYAAQRCVKCDFPGPTSQVNLELTKFRQQFHDAVVAPIQATYEVFSGSYDALCL